MTDTRDIVLGGKTYAVPPLPLRLNMKAYPLCRDLSNSDLLDRFIKAEGKVAFTDEELAALTDLAFIGANAAEPALTREAFDEMPVAVNELLAVLFTMRYQTGGWLPLDPSEDQQDTGEAKGAEKPPA